MPPPLGAPVAAAVAGHAHAAQHRATPRAGSAHPLWPSRRPASQPPRPVAAWAVAPLPRPPWAPPHHPEPPHAPLCLPRERSAPPSRSGRGPARPHHRPAAAGGSAAATAAPGRAPALACASSRAGEPPPSLSLYSLTGGARCQGEGEG